VFPEQRVEAITRPFYDLDQLPTVLGIGGLPEQPDDLAYDLIGEPADLVDLDAERHGRVVRLVDRGFRIREQRRECVVEVGRLIGGAGVRARCR